MEKWRGPLSSSHPQNASKSSLTSQKCSSGSDCAAKACAQAAAAASDGLLNTQNSSASTSASSGRLEDSRNKMEKKESGKDLSQQKAKSV